MSDQRDIVVVDGLGFDGDIWRPGPDGRPNPWWRRPDGSVHAFSGIRSACRSFTWQADVTRPDETDERCRECVAAIQAQAAAPARARK